MLLSFNRKQMGNPLVLQAMNFVRDNVGRESPEKKLDDFLDLSLQVKDVIFQQHYILEDKNNKLRHILRFMTSREKLWVTVTYLMTMLINVELLVSVSDIHSETGYYISPDTLGKIRKFGIVHLSVSLILVFNYMIGAALVNINNGFKWRKNVQDGAVSVGWLSSIGAAGDLIFDILCAVAPDWLWSVWFVLSQEKALYYSAFICFSVLGFRGNPAFYSFHILDIAVRIPGKM